MKKQTVHIKSFIISLIFVAGFAFSVSSQSLNLNVYSSYVFDDDVDSYYDPTNYYNGTIKGGYSWGAGLEFKAGASKGIELKYLHRTTTAPMEYYNNGVKYKTFDLGLNYIMLGANNYFLTGGKVEPYAGAGIGMAIFNINNADVNADDNTVKFAWELKLGANIWANEKLAIKLQADLLSAVQSAGGGFYFGTGGAGAGVSTYSTMYQWGLGGGLVYKMR